MGVQKSGHRCALNLWKGSGRELGEDKEGFWIRMECPDCNWTAWEDSGLPSLWAESQVDPMESTTQPSPTDIVLLREGRCSSSNNQQGRGGLCVTCEPDSYRNAVRVIFPYLKSG